MNRKTTIAVTEDDRSLGNGIVLALQDTDYELHHFLTLQKTETFLATQHCDVLILDLNLPDGNGLDLVANIRQKETKAPGDSRLKIIILTANDLETDIVIGLETGADDYITKPFSLAVLRARVHAQLRKADLSSKQKVMSIDNFIFDFTRMQFFRSGIPLELSQKEQKLLAVFTAHPGMTLTRERLVDILWTDGNRYVDENALSVTINRLRKKLGDTSSGHECIRTIYGTGYIWTVS